MLRGGFIDGSDPADSDPDDKLIVPSPSSLLLPNLVPPTEEEAATFYRGIFSQPRLVGRSSAGVVPFQTAEEQKQNWLRDPERDPWFSLLQQKTTHIGPHRICTTWDSIEYKFRHQLNEVPWTSIDIVRLGPTNVPHASRPVTVWIGVAHPDIPWARVAKTLRLCKHVLNSKGLEDVEVQIRVSRVFSLASLSAPPHDTLNEQHILSEQLRPFANRVGNSISPFSHPPTVGSLSVSVAPVANCDLENRPVWAITCRHVAIPEHLDQGRYFHPDIEEEENEEPTRIFIPSDNTTEETIDVLRAEHNALLSSEAGNSAQLAKSSEALTKATVFRDREARINGFVLLSPPVSAGTSPSTISSTPSPYTKDYCLLELNGTGLTTDNLVNTIDAEEFWSSAIWCLRELRKALQLNYPDLTIPKTGPIKIKGLIPLDELKGSHGPMENCDGDKCLIVIKKGSSQGITFGCPGELRSTTRSYTPDGNTFVTREWAIPGMLADRHEAFSKRGDSGSAIVGVDGRLGGFLTRGVGAKEGYAVDITYATPAVLVLEDIERELGVRVELL